MRGQAVSVACRWFATTSLLVGCSRTDFMAVRCPDEFTESECAAAAAAATLHACGMQLATSPAVFCDTFDAPAGVGDRAGDLDGNVWTVSRVSSLVNFGQALYSLWSPTTLETCDGPTPTKVLPPNDIVICNGQLREASNDGTAVTTLAMVVKQPFDFAGRTGTVSFDVSNDSAGSHSAWPEVWMSNELLPAPFTFYGSWQALPQHGFAIRFNAAAAGGDAGNCPNLDNLDQPRWTVGGVAVVRDYVLEDSDVPGPRLAQLTNKSCVVAPAGPGEMNHIELHISQSTIEVWATDAGVAPTAASLKLVAEITDANLGFTRGYLALEDVHFDGDKGPASRPSQREHTFAWDNVAFDGPSISPDVSYSAPDGTATDINGAVNLAKYADANEATSWDVFNMPGDRQASGARVVFNFYDGTDVPSVLNVTVNGHAHPTAWPFPDVRAFTWRTVGVSIDPTDLVAGTNTVQLGADAVQAYSNVDIVLLP